MEIYFCTNTSTADTGIWIIETPRVRQSIIVIIIIMFCPEFVLEMTVGEQARTLAK